MSAPAVRGRERPPAPARAWWRPTAWPWWAQTLAVWVATRAFSAVLLLVVARTQEATVWTPASPSYAQYTGAMWDASWYRLIAEEGYPDGLVAEERAMSKQSTRKPFIQYELPTKVLEEVQGGKSKVTTLALGEECGGPPVLTTLALGEEGCTRF